MALAYLTQLEGDTQLGYEIEVKESKIVSFYETTARPSVIASWPDWERRALVDLSDGKLHTFQDAPLTRRAVKLEDLEVHPLDLSADLWVKLTEKDPDTGIVRAQKHRHFRISIVALEVIGK